MVEPGEKLVHVGIDDTDSPLGMCTTYVSSILMLELVKRGCSLADFPYLVRLNPNIPFKTRGNGAVSLHLRCEMGAEEVAGVVERVLEAYSERHAKTDPTAVVVQGDVSELRSVYRRALVELLAPSQVEKALKRARATVLGGRKGRGVVGAAASIGAYELDVFTYELLLYVPPGSAKPPQAEEGVVELDRLLRPLTFANVDYGASRVLATPRGPDPVLAGIRSANPLVLSSIARRLAESWGASLAVIFKTNQATGAHLSKVKPVGELRPYDSAVVRGLVVAPPAELRGGHVALKVGDSTGAVTCMFYRETGLQRVAKLLREGDRVEVGGGVVPRSRGLTLNAEYVRVLDAPPLSKLENPRCPLCGKRMKSLGRRGGFKCPACGYRDPALGKVEVRVPRFLEPGLYLQRPLAYRHLSPPAEAMGVEPVRAPPLPSLVVWPLPRS
jgi:tRNA(Ile2)-agmatinylcytidine synthase